jgi:hypothetical protein
MVPRRLLVTLGAFVLAFGCSADRTPTDAGAGADARGTAVLTPQERTDRREALDAKMQDLQTRLEELRQKTDADNIQNEWDDAVAKIDGEADDLGRQLDEFGDDSRAAWETFEARVQRALDSISQEIDEAAAKIKS